MQSDRRRPGFAELLKTSWCLVCNNWFLLICAAFVRMVVPALAAGIVVLLSVQLQLPAFVLAAIVAFVLWTFFDFGLMRLMLNLARGEKAGFRCLFSPPGPLPWLSFAVLSVLLFVGYNLGLILLLVPGIIFLSALCFSKLLIVDNKKQLFGAIIGSAQMTRESLFVLAAIVTATLLPTFFFRGFDLLFDSILWLAICYLYFRIDNHSDMAWRPPSPSIPQAVATVVLMPVGFIASFLVALIGVRTTIEARYIPSAAMEPTLNIEDRIVVEKSCKYGLSNLKRGDIIVFYPPPSELPGGKDLSNDPLNVLGRLTGLPMFPFEPAFIKRVIGLPGDTLKVKKDVGVFVNGKLLEEPYIREQPDYDLNTMGDIGNPGGRTYPNRPAMTDEVAASAIRLGPGQLFVMGDNRRNTQDSHMWGFLDERRVIGRAWFKFYPEVTFF